MNNTSSMWTLQTWSLFLLVCVLVWASPCCCEPLESASEARKSFQSLDDFRTYLDKLQLYYAVAGRPRFGKRMAYNGRAAYDWGSISSSNSPDETRFFPAVAISGAGGNAKGSHGESEQILYDRRPYPLLDE